MSGSEGHIIPDATDSGPLRQAFGRFPSGVIAVCMMQDGVPIGLTASSFTSVSVDPPLVSVCVARTSTTWPLLRPAARLGVSVLASDQEAISRQLSMKTGDRFAGVHVTQSDSTSMFIDDACLWLDCTLSAELPAGDHEIALLEIHTYRTFPDREPLVFHASAYRTLTPF